MRKKNFSEILQEIVDILNQECFQKEELLVRINLLKELFKEQCQKNKHDEVKARMLEVAEAVSKSVLHSRVLAKIAEMISQFLE